MASVLPTSKSWLLREHMPTRKKLYGPRACYGGVQSHFFFNRQGHHAREMKKIEKYPNLHREYAYDFNRDKIRAAQGWVVSCEYWQHCLYGLTDADRVMSMLLSMYTSINKPYCYVDLLDISRYLSDRRMETHKDRQRAIQQARKCLIRLSRLLLISLHDEIDGKIIILIEPRWYSLRRNYEYALENKAETYDY